LSDHFDRLLAHIGSRKIHYTATLPAASESRFATDSQITARPQFRNDSTDLDTARGLSQSYETESTQEQVVGNLATAELNRHRIVVFAVTSNFSWARRNSLRTETGAGCLASTQDY